MNLEIIATPLGGVPLVRDYLAGSARARRFYPAGDPFHPDSYLQHWQHLRGRFQREQRERAAAALIASSAGAEQRLHRWIHDGGAVVTTGQQAGLFSGPLFTIYKALTAVRLARSLESSLGVCVLPVFWVASEDHDWDEVDHTYVADSTASLIQLTACSAEPRTLPLPMSERSFGEGIESEVERMAQILANKAVDAIYIEYVREAYTEGCRVGVAFGEVMRRVLEPFDAYVVDAAHPAVKLGSERVLRRALEEAEAEEEVLRGVEQELGSAGYATQVSILPHSPNLFMRTAHGRERLIRERGGWVGKESGLRIGWDEPLRVLDQHPERVSPNVLLRPVVESEVFPVISYVAGPGEIAYWGQLGGLFAHHGLAMPPVYPRAAFLLVEEGVRESLKDLELSIPEVEEPLHVLVEKRARATLAPALRDRIAELRGSLIASFDAVSSSVLGMDASLIGAVGASRNRALLQVGRLERKFLRSQKRMLVEWSRGVERVQHHLRPLGQAQERVLNGVPYLARYGESLLHRILEQIPPPFIIGDEPSETPVEGTPEPASADRC